MSTDKDVGSIISYIRAHESKLGFLPDCIYVTKQEMEELVAFVDRNTQLYNTADTLADMTVTLSVNKIMGVDIKEVSE